MNKKQNSKKIIDNSTLFQQGREEFEIKKILKEAKEFVLPDLNKINNVIDKVIFKNLSPKGQQDYQTLSKCAWDLELNEKIDQVVDGAWALLQWGSNKLENKRKQLQMELADIWTSHTTFSPTNIALIKSATRMIKLLQHAPERKSRSNQPLAKRCDLEEEEAINLMMIAQLLYENKIDRALSFFRQLTPSLQKHLQGEKKIAKAPKLFMEELVITVFRSTRNDGYTPSSKEIHSLLEEGGNF